MYIGVCTCVAFHVYLLTFIYKKGKKLKGFPFCYSHIPTYIQQTSEQILQTFFNLTLGDGDAFAIEIIIFCSLFCSARIESCKREQRQQNNICCLYIYGVGIVPLKKCLNGKKFVCVYFDTRHGSFSLLLVFESHLIITDIDKVLLWTHISVHISK